MITMNYGYIHFVMIEKKSKTSVWACHDNRSEDVLGIVKWYGPWRQYCFFPTPINGLVFNDGCLKDICRFMRQLKDERVTALRDYEERLTF